MTNGSRAGAQHIMNRMTVVDAALAEIGERSRKQVADLSDISEAQLSRFLNGEVKEPTLGFISRLEKGLGLPAGTLLRIAGYVDEESPVLDAINADPALKREDRATLRRIYQMMRDAR